MAQWGTTDQADNSPLYTPQQFKKIANTANRDAMYANATAAAAVYGVDKTEIGVNEGKVAHTGWVLRQKGTGKIASIVITDPGTGYSNLDVLKVTTQLTGGVNAAASVTTDGDGVITAVTITNAGSGFTSKNPTVAIANTTGGTANGTGATFTATADGRSGRVTTEVLVAGGISGDGSDDAVYPDS